MENTALSLPALDLFGEQVVIQRRSFTSRLRKKAPKQRIVQLEFVDLLALSDEELEALRAFAETTHDYVEWLREYLLILTLRQIVNRQVSEETWREAMDWLLSDEIHPFSFRVCCQAQLSDHEDIRENTLLIAAKELFK
ncbi:hypothetical protein [Azomonas macrocytogenes]|uniref:Uncharacterized protein n=1 Tax=Azomonas macrocytogenes TaxID=69962 RepID=A0A839T6N4_AZOMA|nr:hypothetical protein [Azomonas macrocytogenes]MBB3105092.1 hypothetical protein [Azomonas macrocytogenes]